MDAIHAGGNCQVKEWLLDEFLEILLKCRANGALTNR